MNLGKGYDEKSLLNFDRKNNDSSKEIKRSMTDDRQQMEEKMFNQLKIDNLFSTKNSEQYNSNTNNINNSKNFD